jgi:hypothetical protein
MLIHVPPVRAELVKNADGTYSVRVFHEHTAFTEVHFNSIAYGQALATEYWEFKDKQANPAPDTDPAVTAKLTQPKARPTIAELEEMLKEDTKSVNIQPDGQVVVTEKEEAKPEPVKPTKEELKNKRKKAQPTEVPIDSLPPQVQEVIAQSQAERATVAEQIEQAKGEVAAMELPPPPTSAPTLTTGEEEISMEEILGSAEKEILAAEQAKAENAPAEEADEADA